MTSAWPDHSQQGADGCRFACPIQAKKSIDLTRFDTQTDSVNSQYAAIAFGKQLGFNCVIGHRRKPGSSSFSIACRSW